MKSIGPCLSKSLRWVCRNRTWETITWREGACEPLSSRFARVRVRPAHRDYDLTAPRPEEWLLIEWPQGEAEPAKYWFSTLPRRHRFYLACGHNQTALAHRARLSRSQTGDRHRALRRPGLARLSPPRHALHRRLRLPHLRTGDDSPLRISSHQGNRKSWNSRRLQAKRTCRSGRRGICRTLSRHSNAGSPRPWREPSHDVLAAAAPNKVQLIG